ncbi:uncharacterized protein C2orf15 homolog isoform X2 [Choloepus didactylus]|uniref:uncharacterized protein C2orf15 homolog isoform X2 n=1 Tax=Choloepus didactylus TaxID=27675 RepID=UPI00189D9E94|nr:uncharacterized protein C2orf15 homolog isoform X2 [Choloepus didactylus]XP_037662506.1 uncharacterized protein C2orf15 homolog isoform X2 [Choloepus didactylus]
MPGQRDPQVNLFSLHRPQGNLSNQVEETFLLPKKVPENYLDICSAVPMGFSLSKSATQVSAMRIDSKVDDHLMQGTEESRLEPVTQLFQNTKKIRLEDPHKENFKRSEETGTGTLSAKALGSVVYVKESDGIEMTDVE